MRHIALVIPGWNTVALYRGWRQSPCRSDDVFGISLEHHWSITLFIERCLSNFLPLINISGWVHWTGKRVCKGCTRRVGFHLFPPIFQRLFSENYIEEPRWRWNQESQLYPQTTLLKRHREPVDLLSNDIRWTMLINQNFSKFLILSTWSTM